MRQLLAVVVALLAVPGCGTYLSYERADFLHEPPGPMAGVRLHLELYGEVPEVLALFPILLPDLLGCLLLDVAVLPATIPASFARRPEPLPNLGPPPSAAEVRARRARSEAAQASVRPPAAPTFDDLVAQARRAAPEDAALHARLAPGGVESILHTEEGQVALPELTRMEIDRRLEDDPRDGVALAALGAAWARAGDLDRAEAYLRLGAALCRLPRNAALARAELERVVARRAGR